MTSLHCDGWRFTWLWCQSDQIWHVSDASFCWAGWIDVAQKCFSRWSYYYYYYYRDVNLQNNDKTLSQSPHSSLGQNLSFFFDISLTISIRPQSPCILPLANDEALYQVLPLFIPNVESFLSTIILYQKR